MPTDAMHKALLKELNDSLGSLISAGIVDDQHFFILKQVGKDDWNLVFEGSDGISVAYESDGYDSLYDSLHDGKIFSAKMIDGALVQMLYQIRNGAVHKHRLAFYPAPALDPFRERSDGYFEDHVFVDVVSRKIIPSPVRVDYDKEAHVELSHPACHMTLGDAECCRIPVSSPVSPKWFWDFILRNFYSVGDFKFHDLLPSAQVSWEPTLTKSELGIVYLAIPSTQFK